MRELDVVLHSCNDLFHLFLYRRFHSTFTPLTLDPRPRGLVSVTDAKYAEFNIARTSQAAIAKNG